MAKMKKQNITVDGEQWKQFMAVCQQLDTSASREVRRFVRAFLAEHKQRDLEEIARRAAK